MSLPTAPSRTMDQDTFDATTDAFVGALPQFETDMNALAAAMTLNATTDTSTSSVLIGTGAKTFTVTAGKSFWPGMWLVIADTAAPTTNAMYAQVTSYSGTTLIVNSVTVQGSGTIASWQISQTVRADDVALLSGATFTGAVNTARGTVAMHATTMDLWAQPNVIDGTGSPVTITAIANAPQAGAIRTLYPITGTVIANSATFSIVGGGTYTTRAGDALMFEAVTTSTYKVHILYNGDPRTHQDVSGSRALATPYTNPYPYTIWVSASVVSTTTSAIQITVDTVIACRNDATSATSAAVSAPVPPGGEYTITSSAGTPTVVQWSEYR